MKQKITSLAFLLSFISMQAATIEVTPTIVARSQGRDASRKLVGVTEKVHLYDHGWYMNVSAMPEFTQSFKEDRISRLLFGDDLVGCRILLQGSAVADRDAKAWLADHFFLAPDYNGYFSVEPVVQNFLVDFDLYLGLDDWVEGMYARAHGPIAWSKWDLQFKEQCDVDTTMSFRPGYFSPETIPNDELLSNFSEYACGETPLNRSGSSLLPDSGVAFQGLQYAKIKPCSQSRTGFAELRMELGWNFLQAEDYHIGINAQVAAPTGPKREAKYAFDSVIGNGNHWEAGGGITGHYVFWRSCDEDKHGGFYFDGSVTHVNTTKEERTFDLRGRPVSRYMLAQKMGNDVNYLTAGDDDVQPAAQFKGVFTPVANLTTVNLGVNSKVQIDLAAMFNFTSENMTFDVGYNFWMRTAEEFSNPLPQEQCCPNLCADVDTWALKGDAAVYGYANVVITTVPFTTGDAIPLSATQCGSTINKGTNDGFEGTCEGTSIYQNCGVDNAQAASATSDAGTIDLVISPDQATGSTAPEGAIIKTSLDPQFINCCDINFQRTKGLSHKVFAQFGYNWDLTGWNPYIGFGASAEFGRNESCSACPVSLDCDTACSNSCAISECSDSLDSALSQWAVWVKGGVSFD